MARKNFDSENFDHLEIPESVAKPDSRRAGAVDEGVPDSAWMRLHPLTPLLNAGAVLVIIVVAIVTQMDDLVALFTSLQSLADLSSTAVVAVGVLVVVALLFLLSSYLEWRATGYAITDQAVWFRRGIFWRTQRHARLERIQSIDIVHPLFGRIFGLGRLSIEVAGGSDASFQIGYLSTAELERLRAEIMARAAGVYSDQQAEVGVESGAAEAGLSGLAGVQFGTAGAQPGLADDQSESLAGQPGELAGKLAAESPAGLSDGSPAVGLSQGTHATASTPQTGRRQPLYLEKAPERELYEVTTSTLITSLLLTIGIQISFLAFVVVVAMSAWSIVVGNGLVSAGGIAGVVVTVGSLFGGIWSRFAREFGFRAAVSPDGMRIYRGLTQTTAQTIPPTRVHAVSVIQPFLWRRRDWYRVTITQAGQDASSDSPQETENNVLLPAGTKQQALLALWLVIPDLGTNISAEDLFDACFQGRGRQGVTAVASARHLFRANPRSAKLFDPLVQGFRALALTDTCMVVRDGRVTRQTSFIPFEHIQSVSVSQGPWERSRGLASLKACLVPGLVPRQMTHMGSAECRAAAQEVVQKSRIRRAAQGPERWMKALVPAGAGASNATSGTDFAPNQGGNLGPGFGPGRADMDASASSASPSVPTDAVAGDSPEHWQPNSGTN